MRVTFTCQTCKSPVGYELAFVETHELRRYGVPHYACVDPCMTCSAPNPSSGYFTFETPEEPMQLPCLDRRGTGIAMSEDASRAFNEALLI
jgi:hypothetical protein